MKKIAYCLGIIFTLSGCVETVALATGGALVLSTGERTLHETKEDMLTDTKVTFALKIKDKHHHLKKVRARVSEGRVLLTGYVLDREHKLEASNIVWDIKGVKEVIDEVQVIKNPWQFTLAKNSKNSLIVNAVRAKLLASPKIKSINYDVVNTDGTIYLFGIGQSQDEINLAAKKASTVSGVEKVVSHVVLKYDDRRFDI